jgi:twitching motility protein PilI
MAKKKINLHEYQQDILSKLKISTEKGQAESTSRLAVKVGEQDYLLSLADVSEVLPVPEILKIPLTQAWFLGMANVRGNLYALTDFAHFIGLSPSVLSTQSRILLINDKFGINAALLVDRLVGLRSLSEMQLQKKSGQEAFWVLNKFTDNTNIQWSELDLGEFIHQPSFMQVAA